MTSTTISDEIRQPKPTAPFKPNDFLPSPTQPTRQTITPETVRDYGPNPLLEPDHAVHVASVARKWELSPGRILPALLRGTFPPSTATWCQRERVYKVNPAVTATEAKNILDYDEFWVPKLSGAITMLTREWLEYSQATPVGHGGPSRREAVVVWSFQAEPDALTADRRQFAAWCSSYDSGLVENKYRILSDWYEMLTQHGVEHLEPHRFTRLTVTDMHYEATLPTTPL